MIIGLDLPLIFPRSFLCPQSPQRQTAIWTCARLEAKKRVAEKRSRHEIIVRGETGMRERTVEREREKQRLMLLHQQNHWMIPFCVAMTLGF